MGKEERVVGVAIRTGHPGELSQAAKPLLVAPSVTGFANGVNRTEVGLGEC